MTRVAFVRLAGYAGYRVFPLQPFDRRAQITEIHANCRHGAPWTRVSVFFRFPEAAVAHEPCGSPRVSRFFR